MRNKFSSCLDAEVFRVYPKAEVVEGRRAQIQTFGVERPLVTAGEKLECSRLEDLLCSSREKCNRVSTAPLALFCW